MKQAGFRSRAIALGIFSVAGALMVFGLTSSSSGNGANSVNELIFFPDRFDDPAARRFAEAVANGRVETAVAAAQAAPANVNTVGRDGVTGLIMAVERQDKPMIDALLKAGAHPDGAPDAAPLRVAVDVRNPSIVAMLLAAGADPNATMSGKTPLYETGLRGEIPCSELLLKAGAAIDRPDGVGKTPMLAAAASDHWQTVAFLLDHGASLWKDANGITVAGMAADARILPNNPDGKALPQVIDKIKASGYPWPPPTTKQVRALKEEGQWPPPGKR